MKIISAKEFIDKFGLDVARDAASGGASDYYCHIHTVGKLKIRSTFSDKPCMLGSEWVRVSDLKEAIIGDANE